MTGKPAPKVKVAPAYSYNDLRPASAVNGEQIEAKIKGSRTFATVLLWANLKRGEDIHSFSITQAARFFNLDRSYIFQIFEFFVNNGLFKKIYKSPKKIVYVPLPKLEEFERLANEKRCGSV